jgi:hypothetical protein
MSDNDAAQQVSPELIEALSKLRDKYGEELFRSACEQLPPSRPPSKLAQLAEALARPPGRGRPPDRETDDYLYHMAFLQMAGMRRYPAALQVLEIAGVPPNLRKNKAKALCNVRFRPQERQRIAIAREHELTWLALARQIEQAHRALVEPMEAMRRHLRDCFAAQQSQLAAAFAQLSGFFPSNSASQVELCSKTTAEEPSNPPDALINPETARCVSIVSRN